MPLRAEAPAAGDAWQDLIFRTAQAQGVSSGEAFAAIYAAFLGRANGPRAGWLLASLDPAFTDRAAACGGCRGPRGRRAAGGGRRHERRAAAAA